MTAYLENNILPDSDSKAREITFKIYIFIITNVPCPHKQTNRLNRTANYRASNKPQFAFLHHFNSHY